VVVVVVDVGALVVVVVVVVGAAVVVVVVQAPEATTAVAPALSPQVCGSAQRLPMQSSSLNVASQGAHGLLSEGSDGPTQVLIQLGPELA